MKYSIRLSSLFMSVAFVSYSLGATSLSYGQGGSPAMQFGSVNIGVTSTAAAVTMTFNNAATLGAVSVVTQGAIGLDFANSGGGTCSVGTGYSSSNGCTVMVTFTPKQAGTRYGAVVLSDSSGNVVATDYLQGTGVGPQVNFLPGAELQIATSALNYPSGVAIDESNSIYIVDPGNGRVLKETPIGNAYTESVVPTGTLSSPLGIAVDGSGAVYIADTYNNRILKETLSVGNFTESTIPTSALSTPDGVAVDGNGNIYIADTDNSRILMETLSQGSYIESVVPTGSLNYPGGVAVDGNGNVYITDTGNNRILKETQSSSGYNESTIATSNLNFPSGIAVDGNGNIYIVDAGNNRVLKETTSSSGYTESAMPVSDLNVPFAVAASGNGNVYIADTGDNRIVEADFADAPSLSFTPTAPGSISSDSPQAVTIENVGSATLDFPIPSSGSNPSISTNFTLNSSGASACPLVTTGSSTVGTLGVGLSCQLAIGFAPSATGAASGALVLTDNALNATAPAYSAQGIQLNGIGTGTAPQTISFGQVPAQVAASTLVLIATASSGLPISFISDTPAICTVAGSTATLAAAGTCSIQATQSGSAEYAAASPVVQSFNVNLAGQTITFAPISVQVLNASVPIPLIATTTSGLVVSFSSSTPNICTVSVWTASLVAPGTCTIVATQAGDGVVYGPAAAVTQSFTVEAANQPSATNFGSVNVGTVSPTIAVPIVFNTSATPASISVLTQGISGLDFANIGTGTCMLGTAYSSGSTCTVNVTFTPKVSGTRYGAVVIQDSSANILATGYMQGIGSAPQLTFQPGTESPLNTSALLNPAGVVLDGGNDVYIVDSGNDRVLKETLSSGGYTESTMTTSALANPSMLAIDGGGNIYIADTGNNRVLMEGSSGTSYAETAVQTSALNWPAGVAVDGSGNVYIADTGNNRVLMESPWGGSYNETVIPTSALSGPAGIAVDSSGNIYIADTNNNRVLKETLSSEGYTESVLTTSTLNSPSTVYVDGNGNVYIADTGNNRVLMESLSGGNYIESIVPTSALHAPSGIAVDGGGNVYIADGGDNRVFKEDFADIPSLNFANTAPGATSSDSPQTIIVQNVGNATLTFPAPDSGSNPTISSGFSLNSSVTSACPLVSAGLSGGALAVGQSCLLAISFMPTQVGTLSGSLALTDNALNADTTQAIALSGIGTGSTPQTISFGAIGTQAAGTVLALTATASSGLTVSFASLTPSSCTVSGATATLLAAGTCVIQATQPGNPTYGPATPITQSFTVALASQTITFNPIPNQSIDTSVPVTLTAAASSGLPVSFTSTTPAVCTASAGASTAALLATGTCTIQASQPGDGVTFAAAPTATQSFAIQSAVVATATNLGSVNIGSTSQPMAIMFTFNTTSTLGSVSVTTQGATGVDFADTGTGTCTVGGTYNQGATCTVNVTFTPRASGTRYGAVSLNDASWVTISTSYLQGTGIGPQVNFLPSAESTMSTSALSSPAGITADASGDIYIADTANNRVLKETVSESGYSESTLPTSTLSSPSGIAVDGDGNIYIADPGNNRVLKEAISAGSYSESTIPTSTLSSPASVAVDGSGNVYIADSGNNRVLLEVLSSTGYTEVTVPTSALANPSGVAVDGNGSVYIADQGNNRVVIEAFSNGSYTESNVPASSLYGPSGVAIDGNGNIYIADTNNGRVLKETLWAGDYSQSVVTTSTLNYPLAVAADGSGNVYIADSGNNRVLKEDLSDPPALTFAPTAPGATSSDSPQTVTLENIGNAVLSFPAPGSGTNPSISANFALNSTSASACPLVGVGSSAQTLAVNQSCQLSVSFTPTSSGPQNALLVVSDNALNATTAQSIQLSGMGTGTASQTIAFASIPAQTVTSTLALSATASSGLAVSFASTTPTVCTVSGTTASLVAAGSCVIQAVQAGNAAYAAAATVTQSFAVNLMPQTISFTAVSSQAVNSSITLTASASSGLLVGLASMTPGNCTVNQSTATLLAVGTCTIQASQPGDGVTYAAAPAITQSFTIVSANPFSGTSFGSVNIGTASSPQTLTLLFDSAVTLGSVSVLTDGATGLDFANAGTGTCAVGASYNQGISCTVVVTFTPTVAGARDGAVMLADSSGNPLATSYLQGYGLGPQLNFLPNSESTLSTSPLNSPAGIAVDGNGNVYIVDSGNNRVLKETLSQTGDSESILPRATVLSSPSGVAVDGSGNIYVVDTGNNRVLKETLSAGSYIESTLPTSTLASPTAVAVDGSGNLYIADSANGRVLMESFGAGGYTESQVPTSAQFPSSVAVDGRGNVYIVDSVTNNVLVETYSSGGYSESVVPTSVQGPVGLATDDAGNIYVADANSNFIFKETFAGGKYTEGILSTSALSTPSGVVVDGSGNVYIADSGNNRVLKEDFADPPILSFATTAPGSTSSDSPQTVTIENIGNTALSFPVPASGTNPAISSNFILNSTGAAACPLVNAGSSAGSLAASQSCQLSISFTPSVSGAATGTLALTSNALNAAAPGYATQSIQLSGTGTGSTAQTISFTSISAQTVQSTAGLSATASSGLTVSFSSLTPAICTVTGSTVSLIAGGTCTIQASQPGNATYAAAPTVAQSFAVNLMSQTISFAAISTQALNTSAGVALNGWASSGLTVAFTSMTPTVCAIANSGSAANLLAAGTCTIQANQPGDGVTYAAAAPVSQSFSVQSVNSSPATSFGSVNVGSPSSAIAVPMILSAAGTLGNVSVLTQGVSGLDFTNAGSGTCTTGTSYNAGSGCTVAVTFTPSVAGTRTGAVVLADSSGNVLATSYLFGTGEGPQVNFLPGTEITIPANSLYSPRGIAVDGNGSVYIADFLRNFMPSTIVKETLSGGSYTQSTIATSAPQLVGIAVDGSGSVYVLDIDNNRILKETFSEGSYTESTLPTSALNYPEGVAVDGSGNVYIADAGNGRLLIETPSGGSYSELSLPTSVAPGCIAVDGSGNVYLLDFYNNRVLKESLSASGYSESAIGTSALAPPQGIVQSIAVDGNGNLYIADSGNARILKEAFSGGIYTESVVATSVLSNLSGVAADGSGNIYIADSGNNRVLKEDLVDPPSLGFAPAAPGTTSSDSPQTVTVENSGNAPLDFPVPGSGTNPAISFSFALNSAGTFACPLINSGSSAGIIGRGQSCQLSVSFTPIASGVQSGTLTLTDNAFNAEPLGYATQAIQLSGTGTGTTAQTITFSSISSATVLSTAALSATASSGLAVGFISLTPGVCTVSGVTVLLAAVGTCTIQASQPGNATYAAAAPVTQSFTVNLIPQTIDFGSVPTQALNSSVTISLTATASSGLSVVFTSITPSVCSIAEAGSTAMLLTAGTCTVQANQPGDGITYAAAPTVTESFTIASANFLANTNLGPTNIGSTSSAVSLPVSFTVTGTLNSISVLTQGITGLDFANAGSGTCATGTSYNAGDNCTVAVTFTPSVAGTRAGAVVLADNSGNVLATAYFQGTGVGPQINFLPGVQTTIPTSALESPGSVAVDGNGNVYIADTYNYRVLVETPSAGTYTETVVPCSCFSAPQGIAIDASGNLYIATDYDGILKETLSNGSYTESTIPTSYLLYPNAAAVDTAGNIYISDGYHYRILLETLSGGSYTESVLPTGALGYASGVAVDGSGNVYITDESNSVALKETLSAGSYTESVIPTSTLDHPTGIAVDAGGNVFIADGGNERVLKETLSAGAYVETVISPSSVGADTEVAVYGNGNLYIADTYNNLVLKEDFADPPSLTFASTVQGETSSDSPQIVTLENIGNATLSFPVPTSGNNPSISDDFSLDSSGASVCPFVSSGSSGPGALMASHSCQLPVSFTPTAVGPISGTLVLTDNALNANGTQTINLSGTGGTSSLRANFEPQSNKVSGVCAQATTATVAPNIWFAGKTYHITVTGSNFQTGGAHCPTYPNDLNGPWFSTLFTTVLITTQDGKITNGMVSDVRILSSTLMTAVVTPPSDYATQPVIVQAITLTIDGGWGMPPRPGIPAQILGTPTIQWNKPNGTSPTISGDNPTPQTAVVGQQIILAATPTAETLKSLGITLLQNSPNTPDVPKFWTVQGTNIGDYKPTTASSESAITETDTTQTILVTHWVYPSTSGPFRVLYQYCVGITGLSAEDKASPNNGSCSLATTAQFNIKGGGTMKANPYQAKHPNKAITIDQLIPCVNGVPPAIGGNKAPFMAYGNIVGYGCRVYPGSEFGITFSPSGAQGGGDYSYVQMINSDTRTENKISCTSSQGLDTAYPYQGRILGTDPPQAEDGPNVPLPSGYTVTRTFSATMFLMWKSRIAGSIAVPIGYQSWGFSGTAQQDAKGNWTSVANGAPGLVGGFVPSAGSQTSDDYTALKYGYPIWSRPSKETCSK